MYWSKQEPWDVLLVLPVVYSVYTCIYMRVYSYLYAHMQHTYTYILFFIPFSTYDLPHQRTIQCTIQRVITIYKFLFLFLFSFFFFVTWSKIQIVVYHPLVPILPYNLRKTFPPAIKLAHWINWLIGPQWRSAKRDMTHTRWTDAFIHLVVRFLLLFLKTYNVSTQGHRGTLRFSCKKLY